MYMYLECHEFGIRSLSPGIHFTASLGGYYQKLHLAVLSWNNNNNKYKTHQMKQIKYKPRNTHQLYNEHNVQDHLLKYSLVWCDGYQTTITTVY